MPAQTDIAWKYNPMRVYDAFHRSPRKERLLVGGLGSGKTIALMGDAISTGLQVPGLHVGMIRKTVPELRDTTEVEFLNTLPHELYMASTIRRSGGHIESLTFPNGTRYAFRSVDDWQKFKSVNFGAIYIDELSELDLESYRGLVSRVRQLHPLAEARELGYTDPIPEWARRISSASNSAGKDWMYERFVKESDSSREHWVVNTLSNPYLPLDYLETLFSMPEPWVRRYVLCSFDDFGGSIYPQFGEAHIFRGPLPVTRMTPIWSGYDPGTRHPTAILHAAVVEDRKLVIVREFLEANWKLNDIIAETKARERRMPSVTWRVGDPNRMHVRDGELVSIHQHWLREGINWQNGPSRHEDRIPMLGYLLDNQRFMVHESCVQTIDQISTYKWEDLTTAARQKLGVHAEQYGPEKPVKTNDDTVDASQYLSSRWSRPVRASGPDKVKPQTAWQRESAEIRAALNRQRAARARPRTKAGSVV